MEDFDRIFGGFNTWDDPQYQLQIEEADIVADLMMQLGMTLNPGILAMTDQGNNINFWMERMGDTMEQFLKQFQ